LTSYLRIVYESQKINMSQVDDDETIGSLGGFKRYSTSRSTNGDLAKPEENEISLNKVHSTKLSGIEVERLRTMRLERTNNAIRPDPMLRTITSDERQDILENGNNDEEHRLSTLEDTNLEVDENLFETTKSLTLTREPSTLPLARAATSDARVPVAPAPSSKPPLGRPPVSISEIAEYRSRALSKSPKTSMDEASNTGLGNVGTSSNKDVDKPAADEDGVIWVRSFSTSNGGSIFVGKPAPGIKTIISDDVSTTSADSQEAYAMRQMMMNSVDGNSQSVEAAMARSASRIRQHSIDSQEGYAMQKLAENANSNEKIEEEIATAIQKDFSLQAMSSESSDACASLNFDENTLLDDEANKTNGTSGGELSASSEESDSDDDMAEFGNYTMEDLEEALSIEKADDDDSISSDSRSSEDSDDMDVFDAAAEVNTMKISEVKGPTMATDKSVKTALSEISGSFDQDDADEFGPKVELDKKETDTKDPNGKKKKKKRVFKMATGIGKKKTSAKTVNMEPILKSKKMRKKKGINAKKPGTITKKKETTAKKNMKASKMKTTGIRPPKKKTIEKKKRVQLQSIRVNNGQTDDDIMPRKGEPGVNGE
jgi:hypothetical protein